MTRWNQQCARCAHTRSNHGGDAGTGECAAHHDAPCECEAFVEAGSGEGPKSPLRPERPGTQGSADTTSASEIATVPSSDLLPPAAPK